jgi:hypothetical protein
MFISDTRTPAQKVEQILKDRIDKNTRYVLEGNCSQEKRDHYTKENEQLINFITQLNK